MSWDDPRPMSPHIQVYKLPITAKLSILHRGTGGVLFIGLILMIAILLSAAAGPESWASMHAFLSSFFGKLILFGFTFSLYYHLCNGVRHLFWDIGIGLDLEHARQSGIGVLIAGVVLTLLTWLIAALM